MDRNYDTTFEEGIKSLLQWVSHFGRIPTDDDLSSNACTPHHNPCIQHPPLPCLWNTTKDVIKAILFHFQCKCLEYHTSQSHYTHMKELLFDWIMISIESTSFDKKVHEALYQHIKRYPFYSPLFIQHQKHLWSTIQNLNNSCPLFASFFETQKAETVFHIVFPLSIYSWIHDDAVSLDATMAFVDQTLDKFYQETA